MTPWIKRTFIGLASAALLVGGLTACGSRGHHSGDWSGERVTELRGKAIERLSSRLDLNEAQRQKLGVLADEMLAARTAVRGTGADPRAQMQALVAGERFDRAGAQALLDQKTQAVQGSAPQVIAAMADFYDSLTPAQQAQVREKMARRGGWWKRG